MRPVLLIIISMVILGGVLWAAQAYQLLRFARLQMGEAWDDLKAALLARREMIPYIVAAVPAIVAPVLDVLGNACDLASNVEGVADCSQAEARLSAAIQRVFTQLDSMAPIETLDILSPLRERIRVQEMRIDVLKESYNRQVELFNTIQRRGAGRVLASWGMVRPAELF